MQADFTEAELQYLHAEYQKSMLEAELLHVPDVSRRKAVDNILAGYERITAPFVELLIPFLKDRQPQNPSSSPDECYAPACNGNNPIRLTVRKERSCCNGIQR